MRWWQLASSDQGECFYELYVTSFFYKTPHFHCIQHVIHVADSQNDNSRSDNMPGLFVK